MTWLFGDYQLDPARRELTLAGTVIATTPKVFDLLVHLLQNRERVVSRDDMLRRYGRADRVESTLASHINAVRKAIGDNGKDQRLIRTMARKGFRFVGEIEGSRVARRSPTANHRTRPGVDTNPDRGCTDPS